MNSLASHADLLFREPQIVGPPSMNLAHELDLQSQPVTPVTRAAPPSKHPTHAILCHSQEKPSMA